MRYTQETTTSKETSKWKQYEHGRCDQKLSFLFREKSKTNTRKQKEEELFMYTATDREPVHT